MSQENLEIVQRGYEQFASTGHFVVDIATPDFVWDMSHFHGWPEQTAYEGLEGVQTFLRGWTAAWDDWQLDVEVLHDAGDQIVALMHQRGRSKVAGLPVDMTFAQVWTLRDGKQTRMDMYSDPEEALKAVGLKE
jgi:ketosteroid isomerase-like protein